MDEEDIQHRIEAAGERRRQALAMADSALHDVVDLLPAALDAGLNKREIAELAGVSRLTLDAVLRRRRAEAEFERQMLSQREGLQHVIDELTK